MTPAQERRLIVTWKSDDSTRIVPVAELLVRENEPVRYEFGYLEGARDAKGVGFRPFLAFPNLDQRYQSRSLFPFFANRVLPTTRPDYLESLAVVGLDADNASSAELLGRTNGRRATDQIETILVPVPDTAGRYVTHFLVRGVRHADGAEETIARLQPDEVLNLTVETTNAYNPRARQVRAHGRVLGYVPEYLVGDLDGLERTGARPALFVQRVNPPPHPKHYRLLCRIESDWPEGFIPFAEARLRPYTSLAAA